MIDIKLPVTGLLNHAIDAFEAKTGKKPVVIIAPEFVGWYLGQELHTPMNPNIGKIVEYSGIPIYFSDTIFDAHVY